MPELDILSKIEEIQKLIESQNQHLTEALKIQVKIQEVYANVEQLIAKA